MVEPLRGRKRRYEEIQSSDSDIEPDNWESPLLAQSFHSHPLQEDLISPPEGSASYTRLPQRDPVPPGPVRLPPFASIPIDEQLPSLSEGVFSLSMPPRTNRPPSNRTRSNNATIEYVDLTEDNGEDSRSRQSGSRLGNAHRAPRYADDLFEPLPAATLQAATQQSDDAEITFLSSQRRLPPPGASYYPQRQPSNRPYWLQRRAVDEDVQITGVSHAAPTITTHFTGFGANSFATLQSFGTSLQSLVSSFMPPSMDYTSVGFNIEVNQPPEPVPSPVAYTAPSPAPKGFSRTPNSTDTYVCPNCEDVLFEGDDDVKRQVWVVRKCGHTYCGECKSNRSVTKAKKTRNATTKPFKVCVVDGCDSNTAGRTCMTQLFI